MSPGEAPSSWSEASSRAIAPNPPCSAMAAASWSTAIQPTRRPSSTRRSRATRRSLPAADRGEGILHGGFGAARLEVSSSTISGNSADSSGGSGSGGDLEDPGQEGRVTVLRNTIVADGAAKTEGANCYGAGFQSDGHNIDSLDECSFAAAGDRVNTNPLIGPLASNGGPTQTMALLPGSPAIDAAALPCPPTDQRGVPRPQGPGCDIGAYEVFVPPTPPPPIASSGKARLAFRAGKVEINRRNGNGALPVRCLNVAGDLCKVHLLIWRHRSKRGGAGTSVRRRVKVGFIAGGVAGQRNGRLLVRLNKRGRRMLPSNPRKKVKVLVAGASRNAVNEAVRIDRVLRLSSKKKQAKASQVNSLVPWAPSDQPAAPTRGDGRLGEFLLAEDQVHFGLRGEERGGAWGTGRAPCRALLRLPRLAALDLADPAVGSAQARRPSASCPSAWGRRSLRSRSGRPGPRRWFRPEW